MNTDKTGIVLLNVANNKPLSDKVMLFDVRSGCLCDAVTPTENTSYPSASMLANTEHLLLASRGRNDSQAALLWYSLKERHGWPTSVDRASDIVSVSLRSDGQAAALTEGVAFRGHRTTLSVVNFHTRITTELSCPQKDNEWDSFPEWRPDGKQILFIRTRRESGRLHATLMVVEPGSGECGPFMPQQEGSVMRATYSPDGRQVAAWNDGHLIILDKLGNLIRSLERPPILHDKIYMSGGLAWIAAKDLIVFPVYDAKKNVTEIWTSDEMGQSITKVGSLPREIVRNLSSLR